MGIQRRIYLVGSLKNREIQALAKALRSAGHEVFDDWHNAGPEADRYWHEYEQAKGFTYRQALARPSAVKNYMFDKEWLDWADTGVLLLPAGKSAHTELGYLAGRGMETFIYMSEEPDAWDLMYKLFTGIAYSEEELVVWLSKEPEKRRLIPGVPLYLAD